MKKLALILAVVMMFAFAGCTSNENDVANSGNEVKENQEKFLHDGDTYSAELFVEFANTYEGILDGEGQQVYVFDLRSKEEYDNGHIIGSVNVEFTPEDAESFIERIPSDWNVYIIGDEDEAKVMHDSLKALDEKQFVYIVEGGYEALSKVDGIEPYITKTAGEWKDFTRTEAEEKLDKITGTIEA